MARSTKVDSTNSVTGITYFLPKVYLQMKVTSVADEVRAVEVVPLPAVADTNFCYSLKLPHSALTDDEFKVTLTPSGILAGVSTTSDDRTMGFVAKLGELAMEVAKGVAGRATGQGTNITFFVFDPSNTTEVNERAKNLKLAVKVLGIPDQPTYAHLDGDPGKGLVYRRSTFVIVQVTSTKDALPLTTDFPMILPNFGPRMVVPLPAGPFTKTAYSLTFKEGVLTEISGNRPSELIGFINPVFDLAKTAVSIPGQLLTFQIKNTTDQKAFLEAQKALLEAQKQLTAAQPNP